MGLKGHNAKYYCNYYNIRRCSNETHIYYSLYSSRDISDLFNNSQNYIAQYLPIPSHQENHKNTIYLQNYYNLTFSKNIEIKTYNIFWNLESLS